MPPMSRVCWRNPRVKKTSASPLSQPRVSAKGNWTFFQTLPAAAGSVWKKVQFPFALTRGCDKGEAEVFFTLGLRQQTLDIGGIELLNYGTSKRVADLPFTRLGYNGSEPGATWRKAE